MPFCAQESKFKNYNKLLVARFKQKKLRKLYNKHLFIFLRKLDKLKVDIRTYDNFKQINNSFNLWCKIL